MRRKRFLALALAAVSCAVMAGTSGLRAAAAGAASAGNFVAADGAVAFYSADAVYLNREISSLQSEIDDSVLDAASGDSTLSAPDDSMVYASTDRRRDLLLSNGIINYDNGKVVTSVYDLFTLADQTDALEKQYKMVIYRALNRIGTCFDADGNANHESHAEGDSVLPDCGQLMAGILQSQSVEHLAAAPVTPDNITAGAAAWVDGRYIIGNGADNEKAYQRGIEDGKAGNDKDIDLQYTYHVHRNGDGEEITEDAVYALSDPGGCFTTGYHTHNSECPTVQGSMIKITEHDYTDGCDWHSAGNNIACQHQCTVCGEIHRHEIIKDSGESLPSVQNCPDLPRHKHYSCGDGPANTWGLGCGREAGETESLTVIIRGNKGTKE